MKTLRVVEERYQNTDFSEGTHVTLGKNSGPDTSRLWLELLVPCVFVLSSRNLDRFYLILDSIWERRFKEDTLKNQLL